MGHHLRRIYAFGGAFILRLLIGLYKKTIPCYRKKMIDVLYFIRYNSDNTQILVNTYEKRIIEWLKKFWTKK